MPVIDPVARKLMEAEGYLTLNLPHLALEVLQSRADWATMQFEACFLTGEAFRMLERYRDALRPLEIAAGLRPNDLDVALAQGWCYKRTHRLAQAIDALERAERHHPRVAMVRYNLACYWSLAGNARRALAKLAEALKIEPERRADLAEEPDFDPIRGLPEFGQLLRPDPTPSK
jgi:tetratricopeptide (TPR) repeat protein